MNTSAPPRVGLCKKYPWLRRELLIAGAALLAGLILLPLLIYAAGQLTLGPYHNGGLGSLLKDFYLGLGQGSSPTWGVVVGPLLLISALRAVLTISQRYLRT